MYKVIANEDLFYTEEKELYTVKKGDCFTIKTFRLYTLLSSDNRVTEVKEVTSNDVPSENPNTTKDDVVEDTTKAGDPNVDNSNDVPSENPNTTKDDVVEDTTKAGDPNVDNEKVKASNNNKGNNRNKGNK